MGDSPILIDLRGDLLPVGDQGMRGTCVAFAVTTAHELIESGKSETLEDLSEEMLFWGAKQIDGNVADGTTLGAADGALRRWGQPIEELWPYDPLLNHRSADYGPSADALLPVNSRRSRMRAISTDLPSVLAELNGRRPVVLGIRLWPEFRRAERGTLAVPDPADFEVGGHAVLLAGYQQEGDALLVRNSWGHVWGEEGYAWVSAGILAFALVAWVVDDDAEKVLGSSDSSEDVLAYPVSGEPL